MGLQPVGEVVTQDLKAVLDARCFKPLEQRYLEEPRGLFHASEGLLVTPGTTDEVSSIVTICARHRVGIVPYGGGTGLVGGQVLADGPAPVILSLERMNRIRDVSPGDRVIVAEAGAVLAALQEAAAAVDRLFPLSLAAEGTCQIGGNLATNAGGIGVLRYGNARDLCLGLEAVLPDGTIWNGLKRLRKDNTGYDLKNLLIGSEGSLGIITAASLRMFPRPDRRVSAFLQVRDAEAAVALLALLEGQLADCISAFELIHRQGLAFLAEKLPQIRQPFSQPSEWLVLADFGWFGNRELLSELENLLSAGVTAGLITDAIISQNEAQRQEFWSLREAIPEANRLIGAISSHDISVPISQLGCLISEAATAIGTLGDFRINCFGHVGDGNLHYNIYPPHGCSREEYSGMRAPIKDAIYGIVDRLGGSISAEHGIGRLKRAELEKYGAPAKLAAMRAIKAALDPQGIMNPGVVLRG